MPRLTVCIPTYNRKDFCLIALRSILDQTYTDYQVCIYDDGSTDGTREYLDKYLSRQSLGIRRKVEIFSCDKNRGHGWARRFFKYVINTELFAWQDSDDWARPERLKEQVALLDKMNWDVCFSYLMWFQGENPLATRTTREIYPEKYSMNVRSIHNNTNTATAVFNRKAADLIPDAEINMGGYDTIWHCAMIAHGLKMGVAKKPLYQARRHDRRLVNLGKKRENAKKKAVEQVMIWDALNNLGMQNLPPRPK